MPKKFISFKNRWEQSPNNSHESINFEEVFSNPNLHVAKLLSIENIVEQCKKQNEIFTHKLVLHHSILHDLIQICLRPSYFEHQQLSQLTTQHTYIALEILNNLSEQFSQYLLPTPPQEQDENVITQQLMDPDIDFDCPLVTQVMKILHDPKPISQTPLWYMYKINTSICYQKPKQMIKLFKQNKELSMSLFEHFYSNSIVEWLIKLLEIEDSNSFFEEDKIVIFKYFIESMSKIDALQHDIDLKLNKLENYSILLNTLLQKMEDRFDKTKFIKLTKGIYSQKYGIDFIVQALFQRVQHQKPCSQSEQQIFKNLLIICQTYFHFGAQYKKGLSNSIKLNWTENQKKVDSNNNSNFGIENENSQVILIQLSSDVIKNIRDNVLSLSVKLQLNHNSNLSTLIQFLKLLRTVIFTLQPTQHQFVYQIMSSEFIQFLFTQIQINGKSNILHNLVRDILIESIRVNYQNTVKMLLSPDKTSFLLMISHLRGTNSQEYQYENQLYHIFQVMRKLGQRQQQKQLFSQLQKGLKYEQIEEQIKEKENLYNSLICQNPRQQTWGDSEQDQKLLLFSFNENKKNGEEEKLLSPNGNDIICGNVQHFVQYGLPLDSDESKDEENYLTGSDILEKQELGENYKPIIKLTTSGEYERKQSQPEVLQQNQLARKFKNIGIVQCQQQQIRIQIKKERYGNKSYISNPFVLNPNANLNFNTVTSPKSSPKNSPKNSITKLLLQTKTGILGQKKYIQKQFQKKPMKLLTKQDEEMQFSKQIKILQNKEFTNEKKYQKNESPEIQIKNKKDSFEDKKTLINLSSSKQQQIQNKILENNLSCNRMDQTPPSNKSLSNKNIGNSTIVIQVKKQSLLDQKCPLQQSDESEKKNILVTSQESKEIGNMSQKKNEIDSQEKDEVGLNKKQRKNSSSSKMKSRSSSGKKISFPTYLSYQIDEILAELD